MLTPVNSLRLLDLMERDLTRLGALFLAAALLSGPGEAQAPSERPNVVILLADDLGYGDLGCYGGSIPTPRIDGLSAQGARFTQAYAPAPVCTPSRAGLFTGRYPACVGVQANTGSNKVARRRAKGMPGEVVTLPERLEPLGYRAGLVGKWHLGLKDEMTPLGQGFDEFFGFLGASHVYLPNGTDAKMLRGDTLEEEHEKEYLTDALAREAEAFLARNKERPFVLTVSFNAPHNPFEATQKYLERFPDQKGEERVYAAMVSALDDAVGRILDALEREGLAARTLVFFASDNGAPLEESPGSNGELLLGKAYLFEGGTRVPMTLRWPGRTAPGTRIDAPVSLLDITATTLSLAGASPETMSELDGRDLAPLLSGETQGERALFWKLGPSAAIRRGAWKLVVSRQSRWLFDLEQDPGEKNDLAEQKSAEVAALGEELEAWVTSLPEQLWTNESLDAPARVLGKPYWIAY
jgi:arylsulfatase A-like enzyme